MFLTISEHDSHLEFSIITFLAKTCVTIIHCSKYSKEQMIFSNRHYCNICQVKRPINSYASNQDCSILLQHFGEASKFETRLPIQLMPCSLNCNRFEFLKLRTFFRKSTKHQKHNFLAIIPIGSPGQTFIFIDKNAHFDIYLYF